MSEKTIFGLDFLLLYSQAVLFVLSFCPQIYNNMNFNFLINAAVLRKNGELNKMLLFYTDIILLIPAFEWTLQREAIRSY